MAIEFDALLSIVIFMLRQRGEMLMGAGTNTVAQGLLGARTSLNFHYVKKVDCFPFWLLMSVCKILAIDLTPFHQVGIFFSSW